jgi:hypothetical protein
MFVYPLYKSKIINPGLRRVALRTLVAATVALATSAVSYFPSFAPPQSKFHIIDQGQCPHPDADGMSTDLLPLEPAFWHRKQHGRQLGWVCLASCGTDVTTNALALYWVTAGRTDSDHSESPPPQAVGSLKIGETRYSMRPVPGLHSQGQDNVVAPFEYPPLQMDKVSFQPAMNSAPKRKKAGGLLKRVGDAVMMSKSRDDDDHKVGVQVCQSVVVSAAQKTNHASV